MDPFAGDSSTSPVLLRAIAISSIFTPNLTQADRQGAYNTLEELKKYQGRVPLALQWILTERHAYEGQDITTPTKLLALEIVSDFLNKNGYNKANEADRRQLRDTIVQAARGLASSGNNNNNESRILAKKLAAILQAILVRDFPQRWPTFTQEVLAPLRSGGLWCDEPSLASSSQQLGVMMCLECLKLTAEDCTDSDYNAKISTQRRNDVLIGLNEVASRDILPLLFQLLEQYPLLNQTKSTLHNMHTFLLQNQRTIHSLSQEEAQQYEIQARLRQATGQLLADTLVTLSRFCTSMPLTWILGSIDFTAAFLHLLRETDCDIQLRSIECLDELATRGKLEYAQWIRLINDVPSAVGDANALSAAQHEMEVARIRATGESDLPDQLASQVGFHRMLSKCLSSIVASHVANISSKKNMAEGKGADFNSLVHFLRLLVEMLFHPCGRIASEQITLWTMLLRDPQISRTNLIPPYVQQILTCFMNQLVRIRWEDVENEEHPHYKVMEAAFDDEEEYDAWMADLRSRCGLLFKFVGSAFPAITAETIQGRLKSILTQYGSGQPLDHLDPSNNQLTQKSDAVIQLEALNQPFDMVLVGIPAWTVHDASRPPKDWNDADQIRQRTRAALADFSQTLVSWSPDYLWLRFRRASLLETLRHYWKYEPSTMLPAVDSLIRYIGLTDEWGKADQRDNKNDGSSMSGETIGLKKKSGVALVAIAKHVPHHLVPWLSELSNATSSLLSSPGLIPLNQMHLFEFLTCVASAVEDSGARAQFIANVLSGPLDILVSTQVQQQIASPAALMATLGITRVGENPQEATNPEYVKSVTGNFISIFTSMNRLLSVGKRCNEAARKRGAGIGGVQGIPGNTPQHFVDEGPVPLQELAINDPFAPLWPRILPSLIAMTHAVLAIWRPENQAILLRNRFQRYALAISDDEAYLSKSHDKHSGGVFGEGGTAGSIVSGTDRRDLNLVPKWAGWLNEIRNTCFQMFGLLATGRALFAPEISDMYPALVAAIADPENIKAMEHRHYLQYLKHVCELVLVSCPSSLYATHLAPIAGPIFDHTRQRLEYTWAPVLGGLTPTPASRSSSEMTSALSSNDALRAAELAQVGGDSWYTWYYSHSGLFVGDLDKVTADAAVEKHRVDISRGYSDMLQAALALKGDWALVLANRAKEEQATKRNDSSILYTGPKSSLNNTDGVQVNADGTPKSDLQASIDARKLLRINGICHFMLLEHEGIAGNITLTMIQCLAYPDAYTARRITKICHRVLETVAFVPQYEDILARRMFNQAVKNIVTEPKWMVGVEWDMINVVRDIYCRLVLGQVLQAGGQGPALQQPVVGQNRFEQTKTVNEPLRGGGILESPSQMPRQTLSSIPGIGPALVEELDAALKAKRSAKDQKDSIRDLLRIASDNIKDMPENSGVAGIFERASENESLLHTKTKQSTVPNLPEKLVTQSQMEKKNKVRESEPEGLGAFLFS